MYYGGFSWKEAYNLPVPYKQWFIDRISKEIKGPEDPNDPNSNNGRSRGHQHNSPEVASLQGQRPNVPSRLRRF